MFIKKRKLLYFKYFKSKKGMVFSLWLILISMFIIFGALSYYEYSNVITTGDKINKHLDRATNGAVRKAMLYNYRQDHISKIDTDIAMQEFYDYFVSIVGMNSNMSFERDAVEYTLMINNINLQSEPPVFEVIGTLEISPLYLKNIVPIKIDIPVKGKARNLRFD